METTDIFSIDYYQSLLEEECLEKEISEKVSEEGKDVESNKKVAKNIHLARRRCKTLKQKRLAADFIKKQKGKIIKIEPKEDEDIIGSKG
jgi:hypothetical protein